MKLLVVAVVLLTFLCQMSCQPSSTIKHEDDGFQSVHFVEGDTEGELVLWQELKKELQMLKKARESDVKALKQLQIENRGLKVSLRKMEADQKRIIAKLANTTYPVQPSSQNDRIIAKMSQDLEYLKGDLNVFVSTSKNSTLKRKRRNEAAEEGLYSEVESLKQEITAIKLLEDERIPAINAELNEQSKALKRILNKTNSIEDKLRHIEHPDNIIPYDAQTEFDKLGLRVSQISTFANNLRDKVFDLSDKYKWYSFVVEHFNTELHVVKTELYKMMKFFYKIDEQTPTERVPKPTGDTLEEEEQFSGDSGEEPFVYVTEERKARLNLRTDLDQLTMRANDAYSGVHQLMTRMNALELQQTVVERQVMRSDKDSPGVDQCLTRVGQVKQEIVEVGQNMNSLKSKLIDVNTLISDNIMELRKDMNGFALKCDRARSLAEIVKEHQVDHFSAIQEIKQDLNELDSGIKIIGMKLATLQSDMLNATLTTYKDANKELKQDVQLANLENNFDRLEKKFAETQESLKSTFSSLRQKADRTDFKRLSEDVEKTNEKLQAVATVRETLTSITDSLDKLESQLPQDCSMETPVRYGVYRNGIYLIKPNPNVEPIRAKCDMESDGGFWTVIQNRQDGQESFNRTWTDYSKGFGDPAADHWLGNEVVSMLTTRKHFQLKIDVWDVFNDHYFALYDTFRVEPRKGNYTLEIRGFSGNITDSMSYHNSMRFSAVDKDLDVSSTHCAKYYESGWWFSHCHMANLNGNFGIGMIWFSNVTQDWLQLKRTVMKIRPKNIAEFRRV